MQLVVLLLLVAGLALLVLGLITGSTPLVVASIVASLLAAMAILRYRRRQEAGGVGASSRGLGASSRGAGISSRPATTPDQARDSTTAQVPALATVAAEPARVARPSAHAAGPDQPAVELAEDLSADPAEPENPADPDPAEADTDPPVRSRGDEPVWVIDGRPRYHLPSCAFLRGRASEPVPLRQAVEDGFTPCALCDPDSGLTLGSVTG